MLKRAIFGSVFVAIVGVCLFLGSYAWLALITVFFVISFLELLQKQFENDTNLEKWLKTTLVGLWFLTIAVLHYAAIGVFEWSKPFIPLPVGYALFFIALIPLCFIFIAFEITKGEKAKFSNVQFLIFALSYLGIGYLSLLFLRHDILISKFDDDLVIYAFACIAGVWFSDTFAYLSGKFLGKHKMSPFISPNKTWEGFFGGLIFTAIFQVLFLSVFNQVAQWYDALIYGLLLSAVSTFGDLFQSLWKRSIGIKDSGNIIPGHGGILDRMDAQLLAAPFSVFFWLILNNILA